MFIEIYSFKKYTLNGFRDNTKLTINTALVPIPLIHKGSSPFPMAPLF